MEIRWRNEWPHWVVLAALFLAGALLWNESPETMPTHWNAQGEVDGYGSRFEALILVPLVALGVYLLLLFLPRIDPGKANYPGFRRSYDLIRLATLLFIAGVQGVTLFSPAEGGSLGMRVLPFLTGGLFLLLGNQMGKLRPNWFVGVKTPWTLSSKRSWVGTHRAGGWLFVLIGLLVFAVGLVAPKWWVHVMLGTMLPGVCGLVIYSYVLYRDDPDRGAPAGTTPARNSGPEETSR